jgi:hypothetical protein
MGPANRHELETARVVDNLDIAGARHPTQPTKSCLTRHSRIVFFLDEHIRWRMKPNSGSSDLTNQCSTR